MNRLRKIQDYLVKEGFDAFFVRSEQNITYLTGFKGDSSRLLVTTNRVILITDGRYTEQAQNECDEIVEVVTWLQDLRYSQKTYSYYLNELEVKRLIFEGDRISYTEYNELVKCNLSNLQSKSSLVEELRKIKSDAEIRCLREAGRISDMALQNILTIIKPGLTELDIVAELEYQLKKCGAHELSFETMVLFGERSSLLHGQPGNRELQMGEHILFDFGAEYEGYHADMSRLIVLGKANNKQKEIHNIVNTAGLKASEILMDGVSADAIDSLVRSVIPKEYIKYYYPGIGHGVGLEIHEQPFIKQNSPETISENMVITIEPGLYIPGWGGMRVEDSILVKKTSCESLNAFSRELVEI